MTTPSPARVAGWPVVGNLIDFARNPLAFITRLRHDHGDVVGFSLLADHGFLISHPDDIERVLLETGKRYGKFAPSYALKTILGNGLVVSEGEFWKRQRKLAAPAFHHQSIKQYADQIVAYAQQTAQTWAGGQTRDIHADMMALTQRIIMKILFDVDVSSAASTASIAFDDMMQALGAEMGGIEMVLPAFVPTPSRKRMTDGVHYINGLLLDIIAQRRADPTPRHDLLTLLMDARDDDGQPMQTQQLLDEIRSLYLAGHETTATTLSWAWHLLSSNPDAYDQLDFEIAQVLGGRAATADDVPNLPYANAVIKESLRCYPVAWITQRIALEDVTLGGFTLPKGATLWLSPWLVHHDSRWYTDPEAFQPERWLKDKSMLPARNAYLPFGGGPHICIGNGLAMLEAVLLLVTLLQRHHIRVSTETVAIELAGTLRPKNGLTAQITAKP